MKIEKFEDWLINQEDIRSKHAIDRESRWESFYITGEDINRAWDHQQAKTYDILDYISLIGHQKELDHFLKTEKGWKDE